MKNCDEHGGDGTFTLDQIKEKCVDTNSCGEAIGAVNQAGDFKEAILVGITLLIEDAFRNQNSVWKTRIPGEIKVAEYQTLVCEPKCPNPSVWSSWNCWCEESAAEGQGSTDLTQNRGLVGSVRS